MSTPTDKINPIAIIDCAIHTCENMVQHGLPNRDLARTQAQALDLAKQSILQLVESRNELVRQARDALDYIVHSQANRHRLSTDAEWDENVRSFRQHLPLLQIGRDNVPKASVDLGALQAILQKVADQAWAPVPALYESKPSPTLSFLAYQGARQQVPDLLAALPDLYEGLKGVAGFVYPAQGWIYIQDGEFHVDIDRSTHSSKKLDVLEAKLYTFAADMGYFDIETSPRSRLAAKVPDRDAAKKWTFEEFVSTRLKVDDIGSVISNAELRDVPGFVYGGSWYIELGENGQFALPIENYEIHSHSLDVLEAHMYEYARGELLGAEQSEEPDEHLVKLRELAERGGIVHEMDEHDWRWRLLSEANWREGRQLDERTVLVYALDEQFGNSWRYEVSEGFSNLGFVDWLELNMPAPGFVESMGVPL